MKYEVPVWRIWSALAAVLALAGCTSLPPADKPGFAEVDTPEAALIYYQSLHRLSSSDFARERGNFAAAPKTALARLLGAMLLGYPRAQQDLARAQGLLDEILRADDPAARELQPLARLLADNYAERSRLDAQLERSVQQVKEGQRRNAELQEKIDRLADIERTLTPRGLPARQGERR